MRNGADLKDRRVCYDNILAAGFGRLKVEILRRFDFPPLYHDYYCTIAGWSFARVLISNFNTRRLDEFYLIERDKSAVLNFTGSSGFLQSSFHGIPLHLKV